MDHPPQIGALLGDRPLLPRRDQRWAVLDRELIQLHRIQPSLETIDTSLRFSDQRQQHRHHRTPILPGALLGQQRVTLGPGLIELGQHLVDAHVSPSGTPSGTHGSQRIIGDLGEEPAQHECLALDRIDPPAHRTGKKTECRTHDQPYSHGCDRA